MVQKKEIILMLNKKGEIKMSRQKMISTSKLREIIDLMKEKRVARITIPDTVDIVLFEPEVVGSGFSIEESEELNENEKMNERDLLLHSAI